ncbi:MAG: RNA polymerase sigma-70 factor [Chitinophagaceae bacterium]|nr:MAG: RNA polymerase sigma-70 factor [Chitinophagaceae bacterium]
MGLAENGCQFTCLFRKFEKPLFQFAFKMTKSPQLSADIVQDVFLKLWEQKETLESIDDMERWLHRMIKNRVIDELRKIAADSRMRDRVFHNLSNNQLDTETVIESREYFSLLQQAVNMLPEKRREVYKLRREDGLNYKEISDKLAISQHTVKNQMSGALRTIQRFVTGSLGLLAVLAVEWL